MRWVSFINLILSLLVVASLFLAFFAAIPQKESWVPSKPVEELPSPRHHPLVAGQLEELHKGPFALVWNEPKMQLPDLSHALAFYGLVQRPDLPLNSQWIHLSIDGQEEIRMFDLAQPIYLIYRGHHHRAPLEGRIFSAMGEETASPNYDFSPANQSTNLWLDITLGINNSILVTVNMLDEWGEPIITPQHNHTLRLIARDIPRLKQVGWELDNTRVDSTLLIRQKARWIGRDIFLEEHGGEEFASTRQKERIDFGSEEPYSCFVAEGTLLVWEKGRWQAGEGLSTFGLPLLVVKKIEDKIISLELWDPEGRGKTLLTLVRSKDTGGLPHLEEEFKFIGAKTWAKFIVEAHNERLIVKPNDWLVLTENGWIQLNTPDLIDDFVEQRLQGPLLILEKLTKQNGKQVLTGRLFNTARTEMQLVELATTSNASLANSHTIPLPPPLKINQLDLEDLE